LIGLGVIYFLEGLMAIISGVLLATAGLIYYHDAAMQPSCINRNRSQKTATTALIYDT